MTSVMSIINMRILITLYLYGTFLNRHSSDIHQRLSDFAS